MPENPTAKKAEPAFDTKGAKSGSEATKYTRL
jgi:hypothetical protein